VPDARLERANGAEATAGGAASERLGEGGHLDRVAERVPVPWHSTYEIVSGSIPPRAWASAIASDCPSTLGAVKLTLDEPSLLRAAPLITA
jgi:hypothetical protein